MKAQPTTPTVEALKKEISEWKFIAETQDKTLQEYRLVFQEYKQYFEENKEIIKELHHYYLSHLPIKPQPLNRCKIVKMY